MKLNQIFIVIVVVCIFIALARKGSPTIVNTVFMPRKRQRKGTPNDPADFVQ